MSQKLENKITNIKTIVEDEFDILLASCLFNNKLHLLHWADYHNDDNKYIYHIIEISDDNLKKLLGSEITVLDCFVLSKNIYVADVDAKFIIDNINKISFLDISEECLPTIDSFIKINA